MSRQQVEAVREYCRRHLSRARYEHLERVYQTMGEINRQQGLAIPEEKLALTGFGHDIARELPDEILALLLQQGAVQLEPWESEQKLFCHTKAGALILQKCFGIAEAEILQAVANHTLGNKGLCRLAKLLYVADFLEPGRPFWRRQESQRKKYLSLELDCMLYEVSCRTAAFLRQKGWPLLPPTAAMIEELEQVIPAESHRK